MQKGKFRYSFSKLKTYECPHSFYLSNVCPNCGWRLSSEFYGSNKKICKKCGFERLFAVGDFFLANIGTIVHETRKKYIDYCKLNQVSSAEHIIEDLLIQVCTELGISDYSNIKEAKWLAEKMGKSMQVPYEYEIQAEQKIALDWNLKPCDWKSEEAFFRGAIDDYTIVQDVVEVTDLKSGYATDSNEEQLRIYFWLLSKVLPEEYKNFTGRFHYCRHGLYSDSVSMFREEIEQYEKILLKRIEEIETKKTWEAKPDMKRCGFCDARSICKYKPESIEILETEEQAKQAIERIIKLDIEREQEKEKIKIYSKKVGGISHAGMEYKYGKSIRKSIKPKDFEEFCSVFDCDFFTYITVNKNSKAFEELIDNPKYSMALNTLFKESESVSFESQDKNKKKEKITEVDLQDEFKGGIL